MANRSLRRIRALRARAVPTPILLLMALVGLLVAPGASMAGLLDHAELRVRLMPVTGGPAVPETQATFPATGLAGYATNPTFVSLLPGTALAGSQAVSLPPYVPPTPAALTVEWNRLAQFSGNPLGGQGMMGLRLCFPYFDFPDVCSRTAPFFLGGASGPFARTGFSATAGFPVPVEGSQQPFTTRTVFAGGTVTVPIVATGSNQLTPGGNGQVTLVTPIRFRETLITPPVYIGVAELELHFLPEPALGLLLGWGAVFLTWQGLRRQRE